MDRLDSPCVTLLALTFSDPSALKTLERVISNCQPNPQQDITDEILFDVNKKCNLVNDGLLSQGLVEEIERKFEEDSCKKRSRLVVELGLPSLQKITLHQFPASFEVNNILLSCVP